jgi:hypothetical protein
MNKVPVLATIREAYRFVFVNLGAIIALIWLPMLVVTVMGYFVLTRYYDAFASALASGDYAAMGPEALGLLVYLLVTLLIGAMMSVPVAGLAMGGRKPETLVHFAFGATEWRLFRALLGLIGFMLVPLLLIGVASNVMQSSGVAMGPLHVTSALALLVVLFYFSCIYFGLRFAFLLPVLAIRDNGRLLPRAWALTRGNFWRLFAVALCTAGPVLLLAFVLEAVLEGPALVMPQLSNTTAVAAAQFHAMSLNMPLTSGVGFLIAPLLLGLVVGAAAAALRALGDGGEKTVTII